MSSTIKIPAMPEPLAYWFRHINTDGEPTTQWKPVEPRNPHMNTVHDSVKELLAYRYQDKPCYEVSAVHTADQLAARDAQWQAMYGPVVEALQAMLNRDELNTCQHENTHRGGAIWTICDDCNDKWADDEGGKPKWKDPKEWIAARAALSAITEK